MADFETKIACPPCCAGGAFEWQCRSRQGTATMCGYPEFTSPSVPPKKYRQKTFGGNLFAQIVSFCGLGGSVLRTHESNFSGTNLYNQFTCVVTRGSASTGTAASHTAFDDINIFSFADSYVAVDGGHTSVTETPTSRSTVYVPGIGCPQVCGTCCASRETTCASATEALSQEDTEEDAMARVPAGENDWSAWRSNAGCCTSKGLRGPGQFTFSFSEAEYRIRVKGAPTELINLVLTFTRSDGDPYEEIRQFVAQGKEFGEWQSFPVIAAAGQVACLASVRRYVA